MDVELELDPQKLAAFLVAGRKTDRLKVAVYEYRQAVGIEFVTGPGGMSMPPKDPETPRLVVEAMRALESDAVWLRVGALTGQQYVAIAEQSSLATAVHEAAPTIIATPALKPAAPPTVRMPATDRRTGGPQRGAATQSHRDAARSWKNCATKRKGSWEPYAPLLILLGSVVLTFLAVGIMLLLR